MSQQERHRVDKPAIQLKGSRYCSLDALRGVASLCVVIWHWQHLGWTQISSNLSLRREQPFYFILHPFYEHGELAVDFFFVLSGFIFFSLYSHRIVVRALSVRDFFWLRFSRLYPLHFVTLLIVTCLQLAHRNAFGSYFVFSVNDGKHFILQLLLASNWAPGSPYSFNGPIWSVSIEVLLYAVFFAACRLRLVKARHMLGFIVLGGLLSFVANMLGRGLCGFYLGASCSLITNAATQDARLQRRLKAVSFVALTVMVSLISLSATAVLVEYCNAVLTRIPPIARYAHIHQQFVDTWSLRTVIFPACVIFVALSEGSLKRWVRAISWLGDITYSAYLLHFPMQISVVLYAFYLHSSIDFRSPWQFLLFMTALIGLSTTTFWHFELPVQAWLRSRFLPRATSIS